MILISDKTGASTSDDHQPGIEEIDAKPEHQKKTTKTKTTVGLDRDSASDYGDDDDGWGNNDEWGDMDVSQ